MNMTKAKLSYFDFEGKAEKVRLALLLTDTPFDDERISFEQWPAIKPTTKYGMLPILEVNGKQLHQSHAMLRWLGFRKKSIFGTYLYPHEEHQLYAVEETLGQCDDLDRHWTPTMHISRHPEQYGHPKNTDADAKDAIVKNLREQFVKEEVPKIFGIFTEKLDSSGNDFLCGDKPTIADCEFLPQLRNLSIDPAPHHIPADLLEQYPSINAYYDRMMSIPVIKEWYSKDRTLTGQRAK